MRLKPLARAIILASILPVAAYAAHTPAHKQAPANAAAPAAKPNPPHDALSSHGIASWKPKIKLGDIGKKLKINGFISAGGSGATTNAKYGIPNFGTVGDSINFEPNTLAGLQFDANITPKLEAVLQFVANGSNRNGNSSYSAQAEWAFVRYTLPNSWQVQAGRFRIPAFLYSDTSEVGYSYPWVWLPNEVYRIVPFTNFNAIDVNMTQSLGRGWTVGLLPFFGSNESKYDIYRDAADSHGNTRVTVNFHEDNIAGGVLTLTNPIVTLRANFIHLDATPYFVSASGNVPTGSIASGPLNGVKHEPAYFFSFAGRVNSRKLLAVAEFAERNAFKGVASLQGYYGTLGYHFGKFLPNFTYSRIKTFNLHDLVAPTGMQEFYEAREDQESYNVGLDYYVNPNLVLKTGVYRITPLAGSDGMFDYKPAHKHVYMYTAGLSAIF